MAAATAANLTTSALSTSIIYKNRSRNGGDMASSPERRQMGIMEVESVLNRSLRNENDLLRCQLNDLIHREKTQRIELQRLRQHRDSEVTSMVNSGTFQLKAEVKQLQNMLQSTSEQLLQTLSEREQARGQKEQCARALEELRRTSSAQEHQLQQRLQSLEEAFTSGVNAVANLADSVDAFQRHVLPTFKPSEFETSKGSLKALAPSGAVEGKSLMEQLTRLENGLALLRVIVDAKNDTLVLIRGKLKQENEELKAELQVAREATQGSQPQPDRTTPPSFDSTCSEKNLVRQELQSLQNVFNDEVTQLKSKLKMYESEEQQGQGCLFEVQKELAALQNKLGSVEASRALLEASLKEETAARSQLISQLFTLRKDNEKTKTELETLKLSQKFLVRQPRSGRIPVEKMDLMNTVNQLLGEINKLKGEKVALEEELKAQKRSQVRERIKTTVTSRDVELAASNKGPERNLRWRDYKINRMDAGMMTWQQLRDAF
ncbi:hypothetical protein GOP47_0000432 [Adiantum capillus-veneris]|uniref:Uncharacterized protein n=1 Tax=Adiantum capillus-veneris TaxID=13818 RepID=A0A9D4ZQQ4_ADICA|nr:hypothetical protein GOP47_0000432 [Adiantum capillus-veneris]